MKEKLTVSDSKKLFHEQFAYVIPGLYKRIIDEMLVELNLLNHQSDFNQDQLFCIGLTETFKELTKGYNPEKHLELLFESLCRSSNFDPTKIKEISKKTIDNYEGKSIKEICDALIQKNNVDLYSSRILNLGIYLIISNATDFSNTNDSEKNKTISETVKKLNLPVNKAEKDIGIYKSSIIKLQQAKELLEEIKKKENKNS